MFTIIPANFCKARVRYLYLVLLITLLVFVSSGYAYARAADSNADKISVEALIQQLSPRDGMDSGYAQDSGNAVDNNVAGQYQYEGNNTANDYSRANDYSDNLQSDSTYENINDSSVNLDFSGKPRLEIIENIRKMGA